ncbi:MAG: class I SAM-dependent methyltransferase [Bauldia sp.]|uniref:class I SAM-dependent methyltransferase n=1 Tax=Bauldia sp. TaxID=2575872 RepID=UPI001D4C96A4|nr:class I SAM-dependent methyltransferase [Bauldia sp.]MCB1498000.1 class I SAM-dependent methyltransferase [Bauldia sp.]
MARSAEEIAVTAEFEGYYQVGAAEVMRRLERSVCGCDYGSTSWTTRGEADVFATALGLAPGRLLLDLGAGAGWPALYLSRMTRCSAVLVDLPPTALRLASDRAIAEGLEDRVLTVAAEAGTLPFADGRFDAISHSDVLCCLDNKAAVLRSCRRIVRAGGRMAFTVISLAEGTSAADIARLDGAGPPLPVSEAPYPLLLARADWRVTGREDWSAGYAATIRRLIASLEAEASAVCAHLGVAVFDEKLATQRRALAAVEAGFLRRDFYSATASARQG